MIDDGCTTEGCSLSQYQKDQDAQKLMLLEKENYKRNCEAGNENYCPTVETHPAEVIGFVSAGLIAGPFVENFILGGGAATTADVTTLALKSVYDKALYTCLLSNICSRLFGLGHQEQLTSNQIGDWGEQQVSDQLPVDVRQFRIPDPITGQVRIYDGQLINVSTG